MPFEQFTRRLIPLGKEPTVTLQKRGALALNLTAYQLLGSPKAVHLLYDREESVIGLRSAQADDDDAYPLRQVPRRGETGPHIVTAQAFASHYGIDFAPRRLRAEIHGNILCIDLKQAPMSSPSNQNGRARNGAASG